MSFSCIIMWPQSAVSSHSCVCCCVRYIPPPGPFLTPSDIIYMQFITSYATQSRNKWMFSPVLMKPDGQVWNTEAVVVISETSWFGFGREEQGQEHQARTGITVKCRPHGTSFFPPSVSINMTLPPCSLLGLSPAISLNYTGSSLHPPQLSLRKV